MAKLSSYKGNVELVDGVKPANDNDFPLMEAHSVLVDDNGTRLDEKLARTITGVTTAAEMTAILASATAASVGEIYIYIGPTTAEYEHGAIYRIKEG